MKCVLMVRQEPPSQRRGGCCGGGGGSHCEDEQKEFLQNYMVGKDRFGKMLLLPFNIVTQINVVCVFQVQKT